ncbi:hypothetical protein [Methylopila sp. 73B]|uniref:hypothetical protein n=1 Tax=Methylopila sp. 73B TaxID=1120792 RepID=UPI00036B308A|nr:hypothetical protein [Methylopila sp. 73B]
MSFTYLADDRHACLVAAIAGTGSRDARAAVLRLAGLPDHHEVLDALDAAVAEPDPLTGGADLDRISIALADAAGAMAFRMAQAVIEDHDRDRRIELARAA